MPAPRGPQFSLGHLLAAMGVLSVVCAGLFGLPDWLSAGFVIVATVLLSAAIAAAIVYGRDNVRAFYIGAACPLLLVLAAMGCVLSGGWVGWDGRID